MKKKFTSVFLLVNSVLFLNAQWNGTNPLTTQSNVGIGTSDPQTKLHGTTLQGGNWGGANSIIWIGGRNDQFDGQYINFRNPSTGDTNGMYWWSSDILIGRYKNEARWVIQEMHGSPYGTSYKSIMTAYLADQGGYNKIDKIVMVPDGGNIGIGTPTPGYKLDVNGTIRAKEIKVESNWADFVFSTKYKLLPLTEAEQYIKNNGHLPEIPKAEEIHQNGVNIGEMQTKLLQKIEEMTLFLIELKKENELLSKRIQ